jgi:hypothetical protein
MGPTAFDGFLRVRSRHLMGSLLFAVTKRRKRFVAEQVAVSFSKRCMDSTEEGEGFERLSAAAELISASETLDVQPLKIKSPTASAEDKKEGGIFIIVQKPQVV